MEYSNEMETMKQQIALLRNRIDKESMVNEQLIQKIIKKDIKTLMRHKRFSIVMACFALIYGSWCFYGLIDMSLAFVVVTDLFMLTAIAFTFYSYNGISTDDINRSDMADMGRKLVTLKRRNANWLKIGIPFMVLWFGWFMAENIQKDEPAIFYISCSAGLVIGLVIRLKKYMKTKRTTDEIISNIEEFTKE